MPSTQKHLSLTNGLIHQLLSWAGSYQYFLYYNPNKHEGNYGCFQHILVVSNVLEFESNDNSLPKLQELLDGTSRNLYGFFSYDLKNEFHSFEKKNTTIEVPHALFFSPEITLKFSNDAIEIISDHPEKTWKSILEYRSIHTPSLGQRIALQSRTSKEEYIRNCQKIKKDIIDGEYYEMNYCIEYFAENCKIDPVTTYLELNDNSPMPFSCLGKFDELYTLCASPERFLKKENSRLISQPIKGTIRRGKNSEEDQQLMTILRNSQKEIAENMMIIDLVRNDLNRSAIAGTVKVEEFFGIYTYKQVHQMISTISSEARPEINATTIIQNAFPMGSMTGAPKIRVMRAIHAYEQSQRGIYSGSIGYFTADGNFDFNVVIRSIIYNAKAEKLSFHVGSAITSDADPQYEFEECLLKAKSMMEILSQE